MRSETLGFIGGGNMARSLIGGLLAREFPAKQVIVADPHAATRESLAAQFHVSTTVDNVAAADAATVLILAVKPQEMHAVATQLSIAVQRRKPLIISVAAGIRAADISRWLGGVPVVRCMPNRPALNGCGVTALFATDDTTSDARAIATSILSAVGPALWVDDDSQMDAVTAVSGSGPAYFFLLIEMMEAAGIKLGLSPEVSRRLAIETAYGAGQMARTASESPALLREQVTSKGGTTAAALQVLESADVRAIFTAAMTAAAQRSAELALQLGNA